MRTDHVMPAAVAPGLDGQWDLLKRRRRVRAAGVLSVALLLGGCVVPRHMHVTQGVAPQHLDQNVRFQTTYYFRVFDYCWSADAPIDGTNRYRRIVPETDTLYRYRMTGRASALGNRIKFESGTLRKEQIDPFGADVVYNGDIGGFVYRSPEDAKREAEAALRARREAAESAKALETFDTLAEMLKAADPADAERRNEIRSAMQQALQRYLGALRVSADLETVQEVKQLKDRVAALSLDVEALKAKGAAAPPAKTPLEMAVEQLQTEVAALKARPAAKTLSAYCAIDEIQRRGFQIMGPEGMRPFDQDARLILAMHGSAKPLIETLTEYSGRLLKPQVNPAEQLLPLARETTTIVQTQRALDRVAIRIAEEEGAAKPTIADVFDAAAEAFSVEGR